MFSQPKVALMGFHAYVMVYLSLKNIPVLVNYEFRTQQPSH